MSPPLTVAMVAACPLPHPRGTPVRIVREAEALAQRGHDLHVVTYHHGSGEIAPEVTVHRIPRVVTYRNFSPGPTYQKLVLLDPMLCFLLGRVLRRHEVDVIHAHHYEGLLVSAAARIGLDIPLVYDAHTMLASELPYYGMGLPSGTKRSLARRLDRRLPKWSDHVISITETIRGKLIRDAGMTPEQVSVIANGVECDWFETASSSPPPAEECGELIFTGNLASYQRIDLMLRAFQKVLARRKSARLHIVTDSAFDPYESLARELSIRDAIVLSPADFSRLPEALARAHVALNPRTECDGMPLKLLNYMAAARPTVSCVGSAPGIEHGKTGWLVENDDVSGFAEAVLSILGNAELARSLGHNARQYVEAHHSWESAAEQIESVYLKLTGIADAAG